MNNSTQWQELLAIKQRIDNAGDYMVVSSTPVKKRSIRIKQMLDATGMHITEPNYFIAEPIAIKPPPLTGKVSVYDELDTYVYIAKSIEFKGVVKVGWTSKTPEHRENSLNKGKGYAGYKTWEIKKSYFMHKGGYELEQSSQRLLKEFETSRHVGKRKATELFHCSLSTAIKAVSICKREIKAKQLAYNNYTI